MSIYKDAVKQIEKARDALEKLKRSKWARSPGTQDEDIEWIDDILKQLKDMNASIGALAAMESEEPDGQPLSEAFTNIGAAMKSAHALASKTGKPCYCHGASGRYRMSQEKPESEPRYIQVTPSGNEWTWSYVPDSEKWTKTRLGMLGQQVEDVEMDRVLQLAGING